MNAVEPSRFFLRLLARSLRERSGRVLVALLTVGLGTSVMGAFMTLYSDVQARMSRELRAQGANFVIRAADGVETFPEAAMGTTAALAPEGRILGAQPFLYDVVDFEGHRLAAVGIRFDSIRTATPYWQILERDPNRAFGAADCLLGRSVAEKLNVQMGSRATLRNAGRSHTCEIGAMVDTGGAEDDQIFMPLAAAQRLFDRPGQVQLVLLNVMGEGAEADALARKIESSVPGVRAQPIRKLAASEGKILDRIRSIVKVVVLLITVSSLFGLLIALMAMVTERRREVGLMMALGATNRRLSIHFFTEVAVIGVAGGIVGLLLGAAMAEAMERTMFGTSMGFHPELIPLLLGLSLLISLGGALLPLRQSRKISPAAVLKGD